MALFTVVVATASLSSIFVFFSCFAWDDLERSLHAATNSAVGAFLIILVVYGLGMLLFASPIWGALHLSGRRNWHHAVVTGFLLPFGLVCLIAFAPSGSSFSSYSEGGQQWIGGAITNFGIYVALRNAALLGAIGAVQGFLVWYLAYRPAAPS